MVSTRPAAGLTYEDYARTPDDERWELLDGELVMVPSPNMPHQATQVKLGSRLNNFVEQGGLGHVFFAPTDVVLSDNNVVQPDLLFVSREREHIMTRANIQGAPDLAVEIRSPSTAERDQTVKRRLYEEHGVKEYWLVDPDAMTVTVLLLGERGYEEAGAYSLGQTLTSPTLEGFSVDLAEVFRC
jgi:Uma2 family endonuclease